NFPPYSTGEAKMMRGTGRREIGHGALAERSVRRVLPDQKDFPYVIRIVSDITESNGSSSMASVCGASLSLMDAGVKIKDAVAGVAMGLIKEGEKIAVLTDILGDEDHFGDMDFKVCGTKDGITGLQMDIKCTGLSRETMSQALEQAKQARLHILGEMNKTITDSRGEMSRYAPQIHTMKINPDKIRDVIGPGGKTIRSITETTGVKIDINDDGTVNIASSDPESARRAIEIIKGLTEEAEIGKIYSGIVKRIRDFGAFVEILPGVEGLVHISQLSFERVNQVTDVVKEGDQIPVRVLDIDPQGKIRLSRREAMSDDRPRE
ncbi:MAG: polyribonucleotide nucleotidyltransferase, partial [Deltaproteobacteria bacterium]|nr:polyribonucleotide nucleotidyltransferase [Deltaproteobacteria bacterium]